MYTLVLSTLFATAVHAQVAAPEARSDVGGIVLAAALNGAAIDAEESDEVESGGGLSLRLGYGISENIVLYAELQGANVESADIDDTYTLTHVDLGGRYHFGGAASALRPFVGAAVTGRGASFDLGDETLDIRGPALTLGGGLEYFLSRTVALEAGLKFSFGEFNEGRIGDGDWEDLDEEVSATTSRLNLGIAWHP